MFAKVFSQIFDSSIAENYTTRHLFMDLLVLADSHGAIDMTMEAISRRTNIPLEIVKGAIKELMAPDLKSRCPDEDGKRLMLIDSHRDWGWQIVNYQHYRELRDEESRREYFRDYKRGYRAKKQNVHNLSNVSTDAEGEGEAEGCTYQTFLGGRIIGNFQLDSDLLKALSLIHGSTATEFHSSAVTNLSNYRPRTEVVVADRGDGRSGRVDIVIEDGKGEIGIELDYIKARAKSLFKLRNHFKRWVAILRFEGF